MFFRRLRSLPRLISYIFSGLLIVASVGSFATLSGAVTATSVPVGKVEITKGKVLGTTSWKSEYEEIVGETVFKGEIIATGYQSATTITFIDDTVLKLGADAKLTIDEVVYDPNDSQNGKVVLNLGAGAFYFVSGKVAKENYSLVTPTATIGIRGTELLISVKANGATTVGVAKGRATVRSRSSGRSSDIDTGSTGHVDSRGQVSEARTGVDLTGDEAVDGNVEGVSDWHGEEGKKKNLNTGEFSDDLHDAHKDAKEGDQNDGEHGDGNRGREFGGEGRDGGDGHGDGENSQSEFGDGMDAESSFDGEGGDGEDSDGGEGDSDGGDGGSDGGDGDSDGGDGGSDGGDGGDGGSDGGGHDGGGHDGGGHDGGHDGGGRGDHH